MNVSLTPQLTAYVRAEVASGRYRSASEVVRTSLRLLQQHQAAAAPLQPADGGPDGTPQRG